MNPFARIAPLPPDARGARGFQNVHAARDHAIASGAESFAVLRSGPEFVWVAPASSYAAMSVA